MGISGINPFISKLYGPEFSEQIENIGMGFQNEIDVVIVAKELNMFTFSYAFEPDEATVLAEEFNPCKGRGNTGKHGGNSSRN